MQKMIFVLSLSFIFISCGSFATRSFIVNENENAAAWSRANVAVFNRDGYNFFTSNDYIIVSPKSSWNRITITRENVGGKYLYQMSYASSWFDEEKSLAILESYEYLIRNIKQPETAPERKKNITEPEVNRKAIETQDKNKAKRRVLPNGTVVWE